MTRDDKFTHAAVRSQTMPCFLHRCRRRKRNVTKSARGFKLGPHEFVENPLILKKLYSFHVKSYMDAIVQFVVLPILHNHYVDGNKANYSLFRC